MQKRDPEEGPSRRVIWLQVAGGSAIACCLAFGFLELSGRKISPMWPAAGVVTAFFRFYGRKALAPAVAGHLVIWSFLGPTSQWPILLAPLLYPLEGWLVARLGERVTGWRKGSSQGMLPVVWRQVGAPILGCIPLALLVATAFTLSGRFVPNTLGTTFVLVMIAHAHGVITFGPLTYHLLNRDFNVPEASANRLGLVAGLAGLAVMGLAFVGTFEPVVNQGSAIYLPFPLLIMAAVWLPPAPVSLLITVWCVMSTGLNCLGAGPFVVDSAVAGRTLNSAELGIYNMLMASVAYLLSTGSFRLQRQLNLNEIAMEAAGIELWEWQRGKGLSGVEGRRSSSLVERFTGGQDIAEPLHHLSGTGFRDSAIPDSWRHRIRLTDQEQNGKLPADLESIGRVLIRDNDEQPVRAIGLLQDFSAVRKSEEALAALGYQKARLRSLQANLNPHFLFNSLNVIRALVHVNAAQADQAITALASLLRSNLRTTETPLIAMGEELTQIRALLRLARLRFGTRLSTRVRVPLLLKETPVPPMLLLNLVENAITHGIGNLMNGGMISITAVERDSHVHISVRNSGLLSHDAVRGVGIQDALQRLELLYAGKARFSLTQLDAATVSADVILPCSPKPPNAQIPRQHLSHR